METWLESPPTLTRDDVSAVVRGLQARLWTGFDASEIAAEVQAEFVRFSEARITQFVPILVERNVRARLTSVPSTVPASRDRAAPA
jgi:hypothetical protein